MENEPNLLLDDLIIILWKIKDRDPDPQSVIGTALAVIAAAEQKPKIRVVSGE